MDETTKKVVSLLTQFAVSQGMGEEEAQNAAITFLQSMQTPSKRTGGSIDKKAVDYLNCLKKGGVNCGCKK